MLETNTHNNSALISLSRAAQLTGYHQDYLGQLCRLGKLPAQKVGRNWFTFPEALNRLSVTIPVQDEQVEELEQLEQLEQVQNFSEQSFSSPQVVQNVTVSQVEGMPIAIRTIAMPARNVNTVQNILTTLRMESMQREILELRQMLTRLMAEVSNHSKLLQDRTQTQSADQLRHAYVSNFDFNAPYSSRNLLESTEQNPKKKYADLNFHQPRYSFFAVLSASAVFVAFAFLSYGIISGQFFGPLDPEVKTVYYQNESLQETSLEPTVAGETLPTGTIGDLPQNMVE